MSRGSLAGRVRQACEVDRRQVADARLRGQSPQDVTRRRPGRGCWSCAPSLRPDRRCSCSACWSAAAVMALWWMSRTPSLSGGTDAAAFGRRSRGIAQACAGCPVPRHADEQYQSAVDGESRMRHAHQEIRPPAMAFTPSAPSHGRPPCCAAACPGPRRVGQFQSQADLAFRDLLHRSRSPAPIRPRRASRATLPLVGRDARPTPGSETRPSSSATARKLASVVSVSSSSASARTGRGGR